jgi:sugar lactone lactonase YvrE
MPASDITAELVLAAGDETGESPVWDEQAQALWWTDIPGRRLHVLHKDGAEQVFPAPGRVGSFALRRDGGLVLGMENGLAFWDPPNGDPVPVAEPERGLVEHRFNDGRCDRQGRFLVGSMNLHRTGPTGQLWRLDGPDGAVTRLTGKVSVANGLAFTPDGARMFWACSREARVWAFDYDRDTGTPRNRRTWLDEGAAPGRPDGAAIDAEGCYWSARWMGGCVARFTPDGTLDRIIRLPVSRVTMCAFGGPDLRTLFITTAREGMTPEELAQEPLAGGLFAAQVGAAGLPEPRFAG